MDNKEIVLRLNSDAIAILQQEIKSKRDSGVANSVGDRFLIRLLEGLSNNTKAFLFKIEKNKIVIRHYATLTYDDHRQIRTDTGKNDGAIT